jgi:ferric-dicitrate binding protein FerR (iron transport regulator)
VRPRATSGEWAYYYQQADRTRRRFGDPFKRLIERAARRERRFRVIVTLLAIGAGATLVFLSLWVVNTVNFESILDEAAGPQDSISSIGPTYR